MQPCSTLADRPTAGPSDRLPLRLIRPARPTRETGRHPGNPSAPRDLLTGSPAVYTAFMELRDRPPAVCTYVVMHDRMNKKGDMLVGTNISRSISKGAAFCLYREWATACGSWRRWCWRVDGEGSTEGMSGCGCVGVGGGRAYLLELSWQRAATRGRYGQVGCGCALATLGSPEATQLAHLRSPHVLLTFAARSPHVLLTISSRSPPGNETFSEF